MGAKASIGKPIRRRFIIPRFDLPRLFRWVLVVIIYLITFSVLDQLTHTLQLFPGVVAWYPPDGLSLAFLLTFGAGFTPAFTLAFRGHQVKNFTAELLRTILSSRGQAVSFMTGMQPAARSGVSCSKRPPAPAPSRGWVGGLSRMSGRPPRYALTHRAGLWFKSIIRGISAGVIVQSSSTG